MKSGKNIWKQMIVALAAVLLAGVIAVAFPETALAVDNIASGGDENITWVIDADGKLTVTGTGDINRTEKGYPEWRDYCYMIRTAKISVTGMTDASNLFWDCANLESVDLSEFDTSSVTSMSHMFYGCESLTTLDLSRLDTSSVTSMEFMFSECHSLTTLNLRGLDTSNVTSMKYMFSECDSLTTLDLRGVDTSSVTSMRGMFGDTSLTTLDLSSFDLSKAAEVDDNDKIFSGCTSLTTIYAPKNVVLDISLPSDESLAWCLSDGTVVKNLPKNSRESTVLTRKKKLSNNNTVIKQLSDSNTTIKLSEDTYTYDAKAKQPTVTVYDFEGSEISKDNYTVTYTNNIEVGTARVTITFKGNYTGIITKNFEITASELTIQNTTVTLSKLSYTYDGKANEPAVIIKDTNGNEISKDNYTVTYTNNIEVGTARVTITFKGNYAGTITQNFEIIAQNLTTKNTTVKLSKLSYTYDGKAKKPTVIVKDSEGNTIDAKYYTVAYKNNKKVGKATVAIKFKGDYTGTIKAIFTINPKATSLKTVSSAKSKTLILTWNKQATQTTGYEIQYATNSKFAKNEKIVTVKGAKTTSKTIKKLSAKTKYYVHIRTYTTVGGKNFYSAWSKVLSVKTK
jgi:surface protein